MAGGGGHRIVAGRKGLPSPIEITGTSGKCSRRELRLRVLLMEEKRRDTLMPRLRGGTLRRGITIVCRSGSCWDHCP